MVGEILSTRLLVLFSPSGSGKTSLINAGVRPALEKLGYQTVYVRLDKDPIPSVQSAVAEAVALSPSTSTNFATSDLHDFLKNVTRQTEKPVVVFIDQFEEFFIVFANKQEARQKFIEQVAKIKYDDQLPVFLVLSLREDYFADLHEFREAIPSIFQNNANIRLEDFTEAEARRAIEEPVKVVGCEFEAGLVERLLQDLKNGKPGIEPITLQIVCDSVWQEKPANATRLTRDEYEASGGAAHILKNYVSGLLDDLPSRQQSVLARIFEVLKTPDNTKRYRSFEDLQATLKLNGRRLKEGLKKLVNLNLLRQEQRAGAEWYEFKHDRLVGEITQWLQNRKEKLARRRLLLAGLMPVVLAALGLGANLFYQHYTFKAGLLSAEHPTQQDEIAIFRASDDPQHPMLTTGWFFDDLRGHEEKKDIKEKFNLGFWTYNWKTIAVKLEPVKNGIALYRLGEIQVALDSLVAALKDEDYAVRRQAAAALGNLGKSDDRVISALVAALKDQNYDVRSQAAAALGNLGKSDDRVISALVAALKDEDHEVRSQDAAAALGNLLQPKLDDELFELLANNLSGYRTAGAQALARQDSLPPALLKRVDQLRQDDRPWVRLAAWEAYDLMQARLKSEAEAKQRLQEADSVFASEQWSVASDQYEAAFDVLKGIIRVDSVKTARAKFQQAHCAAKLKRIVPALDDLKIAFEYNPTWRDTLQAELAQPNNDWAILQGNWYLREVLLKKR